MKFRTTLGVLLAGFSSSAALEAQPKFVPIPGSYSAMDITPDGDIVVGSGQGGGYYWRWQTDPAPISIGGYSAVAVSDDGSVIVGDIPDPISGSEVAAKWTQATGWVSLGYLPNALSCPSKSNAYDVTGDGSTVVGLSWDGCKGRGFRWTAATGMVQLQKLGNDSNRASAISSGGEMVGGFAQGNFSRTPAVWYPDNTGNVFDMNSYGEVFGFNADGSTSVGTYNFAAFYMTSAQGLVSIGNLKGSGWSGNAMDITADGKTIVGFDSKQLAREAWIWTATNGIQSLRNKLISLGVPNVPATIEVCQNITPDGSVIIGHTGFNSPWIATLPSSSLETYGCGANPPASMAALGTPELGGFVVLALDNPLGTQLPGASTMLLLSLSPAPGYPCGLPAPGLGMTLGAPGELLIGPSQLFALIPGPSWLGPGQPSTFTLNIPVDPILVGISVYAQGALIGTSGGIPKNALTDAAKIRFGYY